MRRILVVDDEFPIREWLTHIIRDNRPQYEVCSAQNGLDALQQMQAQSFDLIISDIRMPQLDGISLFEQVNQLHPGTGIIVLSSYDDYLYVRSAFKHAAVDYLLKAEISESSFLAALDNFFDQRQDDDVRARQGEALHALMQGPADPGDDAARLVSSGLPLPDSNYFLFLFRASKPYIPCNGQTTVLFCAPVESDLHLGCACLNTVPSMLIQYQEQHAFLEELKRMNDYDLLLACALQRDQNAFVPMIRLLYSYRTIGFYHKKYLLLSTTKEPDIVQYFRRYVEVLNAIGTREPQTIRTALTAFLDHVEQTMFTDLSRLQFAAVKILDELCLKLTDLDMEALARLSQSFSGQVQSCADITAYRRFLLDESDALLKRYHTSPMVLSSRMERAVQYIEENLAQPLTLNEVAALIHLNPEYFSRSFKKEVGSNFNNYVNEVRLRKAIQLVAQTDKKLFEIAEECGFQSFSYFSKRFKELYGVSPYTLRSSSRDDSR